jgi:acetylornithine deacetylase/succinyl-diaminopimelate desuccinylase-like protein
MQHVREIAREPHPPGTAAHGRAHDYLVERIGAMRLTPNLQDVTAVGTRYAVAGRVRNVLTRIPGKRPGGKAVLLMAHYDGVAAGPAAGDDASGSAVLLETLRAIRAGEPLENDVIALFTDAEEAGLLGAAGFVAEHPWAKDVGVVLNFEARGTHGPSLMFETGKGNLDVVRVLRRVPGVRATSLSTAVYRVLPNDTDLSELALLEQPAMNFAFIGGVTRYHTSEDDVAHLSAGSVQHHGNNALALTRAFGDGPCRGRSPATPSSSTSRSLD